MRTVIRLFTSFFAGGISMVLAGSSGYGVFDIFFWAIFIGMCILFYVYQILSIVEYKLDNEENQ